MSIIEDVRTYIRRSGETMNNAIRHGTIHIPPKDMITHLGFFKDGQRGG
jgi:hypothetical protein